MQWYTVYECSVCYWQSLWYSNIFVLFDFADLEDIQRKRRKQIPSFSNNDSFMTVSGLLALLLFNLLITVSH